MTYLHDVLKKILYFRSNNSNGQKEKIRFAFSQHNASSIFLSAASSSLVLLQSRRRARDLSSIDVVDDDGHHVIG